MGRWFNRVTGAMFIGLGLRLALQQAKAFKEAVGVTGVILSKLDSSARGGMAFAIQRELKLPILFAGLGDQFAP